MGTPVAAGQPLGTFPGDLAGTQSPFPASGAVLPHRSPGQILSCPVLSPPAVTTVSHCHMQGHSHPIRDRPVGAQSGLGLGPGCAMQRVCPHFFPPGSCQRDNDPRPAGLGRSPHREGGQAASACPSSSSLGEDREQLGNVRVGNPSKGPRALHPPGNGEKGSRFPPALPAARLPPKPGTNPAARLPRGATKLALWGHRGHLEVTAPPQSSPRGAVPREAPGSSNRDGLIQV